MPYDLRTRNVEFTGGPLDGLREPAPPTPTELAEVIAIPINTNLLSAIEGRERGPKAPATSVAIYELAAQQDGIRYRFLGPSTARQFRMERWRG